MTSTIAFVAGAEQPARTEKDAVLECLMAPDAAWRPWSSLHEQRFVAWQARCAALVPYAADPVATPDLLRRIKGILPRWEPLFPGTGEADLYAALARNPNTPPDILATCAIYSPASFCANPATPLLILESPDLVRQLGWQGRSRLLRQSRVPALILAVLAAYDKDREDERFGEANLHIGLSGEVPPEDWHTEVTAFWREYVACGRSDSCEMMKIQELAALGWGALPEFCEPDIALRERFTLACDTETDPEWLTQTACAQCERWVIRLAAGLNPALPTAIRDRLRWGIGYWGYSRYEAKQFVEENCLLSSPEERSAVEQAIRAAVREVARRRYLKCCACHDPLLQFFLMRGLSEERTAARYIRIPSRRQRTASDSDDWRMRLAAAMTLPALPSTPKGRAALSRLAEDGNRLVRAAAKARLANPTAEVSVL